MINWNTMLNQTEFSFEDLNAMDTAASSWTTCAVGNCKVPRKLTFIKGFPTSPPQDKVLYTLGMEFSAAIKEMWAAEFEAAKDKADLESRPQRLEDWRLKAQNILIQIELRASIVLNDPSKTIHYEIN